MTLIHNVFRRGITTALSANTKLRSMIAQHTQQDRQHLTPEIPLYLITEECKLWTETDSNKWPFHYPYWAFYWPGGQGLARFVLDNPDIVKGKQVLDVGSGCGAVAIASKLSGATTVLANDIDTVAISAIEMNAEQSSVNLELSSDNLIGKESRTKWDIIFVGDMFYDIEFSTQLIDWLHCLHKDGSEVMVGDPGRVYFKEYPSLTKNLKMLETYSLNETSMTQNNGFTSTSVWRFR